MKRKLLSPIIVLAASGVAFSTFAHDPKEHMKNVESPNCAAMKNMDHSNMDKNDPVMQAMMKQCKKEMYHDEGDHSKDHKDASNDEHTKDSEKQHSEHQH